MRDFDIRKLQKVELDMFRDIARFCDENDIKYFISDGTLLGAARHQGFIPWDDDVDLNMDLKNYKKFVKLSKNLPDKYFVQNFDTDKKVFIGWTKIRINGTTCMERHLNNFDIHYGIGMDIFLMNGIPNNKILQKLQRRAMKLQNDLRFKYYYLEGGFELKTKREKFMYKTLPESLRRFMIKVLDVFVIYDATKCDKCYCNFNRRLYNAPIYPTELLDEFDTMVFEGVNCPVLKRWDEYLTIHYGDWRTPPPDKDRTGHGDLIVDFEKDYTYYQSERLKAQKNKK